MKRRDFLGVLGGAAAAWPLSAREQQSARKPQIAVLMQYADNDPQGQIRAAAFMEGLESAGWKSGRNITVEFLWGAYNPDWTRTVTARLQQLAPDVIVANNSISVRAVQSAALPTPTVFIGINEPVAQGFVASLSHPGGNMTGVTNLEPTVGAKWIGLLKEITPQVKRVAFIYNRANPSAIPTMESARPAAQTFLTELIDAPVSDLTEIEAVLKTVGRERGGAVVLPTDTFTNTLRKPIVQLAAVYRLPVISSIRSYTEEGGLLTYGVNQPGLFRRAASFVNRILRGEKPGDIPVEQPTKFEMVINLKTAKELELTVPATLLAQADEVIE